MNRVLCAFLLAFSLSCAAKRPAQPSDTSPTASATAAQGARTRATSPPTTIEEQGTGGLAVFASRASNARCLTLGTEAERSECLQREIDELRQTLELYRDLFDTKLTRLDKDTRDALHDGIYAPPREVTRFEDIVVSTDMWWGGKRYLGATNLCYPKLQEVERGSSWDTWFKQNTPAGSVFYVAEKKTYHSTGCKTGPTCDSQGERCDTHKLVLGCFVTERWLDWYLKHMAAVGMNPSGAFICADLKK